jgi:hypothetical protein
MLPTAVAKPKEASARMLVVEAEMAKVIGDRHIEMVPGVGRIGTRVQYREHKEVGAVQHPFKVTHTYPTALVGRFERAFDSFETKVELPVGAFTLKAGK